MPKPSVLSLSLCKSEHLGTWSFQHRDRLCTQLSIPKTKPTQHLGSWQSRQPVGKRELPLQRHHKPVPETADCPVPTHLERDSQKPVTDSGNWKFPHYPATNKCSRHRNWKILSITGICRARNLLRRDKPAYLKDRQKLPRQKRRMRNIQHLEIPWPATRKSTCCTGTASNQLDEWDGGDQCCWSGSCSCRTGQWSPSPPDLQNRHTHA